MALGIFMRQKIYIGFVILLFCLSVRGQQVSNLVPNGNFEEVDSCFDQIPGLWKVNDWSAAVPNNVCSSDYFNQCQLAQPWLPKEPIQKILGNGSAAILLKTTVPKHREYLQNKLLLSLERDTIYELRLKLRPIYNPYQTEWGTDRIEILFSATPIKANIVNNNPSNIDTCPSVVFKNTYLDTNEWYHCKSYYQALGNEKFLTIGIFSPDSVYDFYPIGEIWRQQWKSAYYLIDDVMVFKASDTIVRKQPEPKIPNVFSPNQDGVNEFFAIKDLPENSTLEMFNRWGNLVFTQQPYQNNWHGEGPNGRPLAEGVYFAILSYQDRNGHLRQLKQTVHVVR